ncbi:hypothetical protein, partial [Streptococcus suis]
NKRLGLSPLALTFYLKLYALVFVCARALLLELSLGLLELSRVLLVLGFLVCPPFAFPPVLIRLIP